MREGDDASGTVVHGRGRPVGRGLRAARGRQLLPGARGRRRRTPTWSTTTGGPGTAYPALNLADPTVAIPWPIPLAEAEISEKDLTTPDAGGRRADGAAQDADRRRQGPARHARCRPTSPAPTWSTSGRARRHRRADPARSRPGRGTSTAWCSTPRPTPRSTRPRPRRDGVRRGRRTPAPRPRWPGSPPSTGSRWCTTRPSTSSTAPSTRTPRTSRSRRSGVYAQTKAAGDVAVATAPRHYVLRTSWVIGDGKNFVRTMQQLAANGVCPDGRRRPGRPADLHRRAVPGDPAPARRRRAVRHLQRAATAATRPRGRTSPRRSSGSAGATADDVTSVTTEEYFAGRGASRRDRAQRDGPVEDRGDRLRPGERPRPAAATTAARSRRRGG